MSRESSGAGVEGVEVFVEDEQLFKKPGVGFLSVQPKSQYCQDLFS
ncbi:MAG: hypothetical protein AABW67_02085 [Nanoarchaeota archaeon]